MPDQPAAHQPTTDFEAHIKTVDAMRYDGTLASFWRILDWAKSKNDTAALAKEWIFHTPIITFPGNDARFHAVERGDYVVWNGLGFRVWTVRS